MFMAVISVLSDWDFEDPRFKSRRISRGRIGSVGFL